jgi:hypothetical protein
LETTDAIVLPLQQTKIVQAEFADKDLKKFLYLIKLEPASPKKKEYT